MNDDFTDPPLDAALEALAHPKPPHDHVAEVLARTSGTVGSLGRAGSPSRSSALVWSLATAAAALVALGATWLVARIPVVLPEVATAGWNSAASPRLDPQIDLPVLPPQAYWGMDAFTEFETLRPGGLTTAPARSRDISRRPSTLAQATSADDEMPWVPLPSGLAPIELPSILPAPLVVAPMAPLEDIALAEIPVEPIVIAPLIEEERP